MKKLFSLLLLLCVSTAFLAGCGAPAEGAADTGGTADAGGPVAGNVSAGATTPGAAEGAGAAVPAQEITVIAREASSGTRGAFDELMGILVKNGDVEEDRLFAEAVIVDSTDAVASKVEVDPYAIGYTSLGSITEKVRALRISGVDATEENVQNGSYGISRPFVVATKGAAQGLAADFIAFITSTEGQAIVKERGYVEGVPGAAAYTAAGAMSGKLVLGGSTSVEKVMEKLKEAYVALHPDVTVEIQYTGSGTGIKDVQEGKVDIAMSSRALKEEEAAVLQGVSFALDGIAVIVNVENPLMDITPEMVTKIFTGEVRTWNEVQ